MDILEKKNKYNHLYDYYGSLLTSKQQEYFTSYYFDDMSLAEIADAYAKAQAIAWEECPWIFLGNDQNIHAQRSYVTGMQYKPGGVMVFRTIGLDH